MDEKKIITLDLTNCKYLGELHKRIKEAFDFPDFYGENWDAFWDLLGTHCDVDGVKIIGEHTLPKEFENDIKSMHELLQINREAHAKYQHDFSVEILS